MLAGRCSDGADGFAVYGDHGAGDIGGGGESRNAAARPNSAGSQYLRSGMVWEQRDGLGQAGAHLVGSPLRAPVPVSEAVPAPSWLVPLRSAARAQASRTAPRKTGSNADRHAS